MARFRPSSSKSSITSARFWQCSKPAAFATAQKPGCYGRQLHEFVRAGEPERAVDRLLVASLIEARSCERFALLRDHVVDRALADFYGSLFESEARHHSTYVQLAGLFAGEAEVRARLDELSAAEAAIIREGDALARMHS